MVNPERMAELFFELSNISRLEILLAIDRQALKQSQIAKEIDLSIQETSRHLSRLCDARMALRDADGLYTTTPFGKQILSTLPSLNFIISNSDYFANHDVSIIPEHLRYGLGFIEDYKAATHVMESFRQVEDLIRESNEFIWILSDHVLSSTLPLIEEATQREVEFRLVLPKDIMEETHSRSGHPDFSDTEHRNVCEKYSDRINHVIIVTDAGAILSFPTLEGKPDYLGFQVRNEKALKWCQDLFLHYWESANEI